MAPLILYFLILFTTSITSSSARLADPTPTTWPEQFHSTIIWQSENKTQLDTLELWYDWTNGVSMSIVQRQLGKLLYGPEWSNGTSFRFTVDSSKECSVLQGGMVRPDWFRGAKYVGQVYMDDFLCNAWIVDGFMMYYEEVAYKRPVAWKSLEGQGTEHVMTFEVGKVLDHSYWQAPVYCFNDSGELKKKGIDKKRFGIYRI